MVALLRGSPVRRLISSDSLRLKIVVGLVPAGSYADRFGVIGDGLVEITFGAIHIRAHEVDERQFPTRVSRVLHELDATREIGNRLV